MNNKEEIEKLAIKYTEENSSIIEDMIKHRYFIGSDGFINGFETCQDRIAEIVRNNPNDKILGKTLRSLFRNGIRK